MDAALADDHVLSIQKDWAMAKRKRTNKYAELKAIKDHHDPEEGLDGKNTDVTAKTPQETAMVELDQKLKELTKGKETVLKIKTLLHGDSRAKGFMEDAEKRAKLVQQVLSKGWAIKLAKKPCKVMRAMVLECTDALEQVKQLKKLTAPMIKAKG